jgi:hypothetical protein
MSSTTSLGNESASRLHSPSVAARTSFWLLNRRAMLRAARAEKGSIGLTATRTAGSAS